MHSCIVKRQSITQKSKSDFKEYELITLDNGLECLIVIFKSDKNDKNVDGLRAAAALSVQTGSFADPSDVEGLAHFVEHM